MSKRSRREGIPNNVARDFKTEIRISMTDDRRRLISLANKLKKLFDPKTIDFLLRSVEKRATTKKESLKKKEKQPSKYLEVNRNMIFDKTSVQKELNQMSNGFLNRLSELSEGYANYLLAESISKKNTKRRDFIRFKKEWKSAGADMRFIYEKFRTMYPEIPKNTLRTWNHRYKF